MKKIVALFRALNSKMVKYPRLALLMIRVLPSNSYLFGKTYKKLLKTIDFEAQVPTKKLLEITNFAINYSRFYSSKIKEEIKSMDDFEQYVPFITKEELVNRDKDTLTFKFKKSDYEIVTTGGTSGAPTKLYSSKDRFKKEYAFFHKIWKTKGYCGQMRGVIRNQKLPNGIVFKINPITKEMVFDGFKNDIGYLRKVFETLKKYNIQYLQCYPSSAYYFANAAHQENWDISFLKGIFLSSEKYLDYQIKLLNDTMKLPVISVYGHSEKLVLAVDFEGTGQYKVLNDYGYLELVDSNDQVIKTPNQLGEIIGTTYDNFGQPLVRYKTGDFSSYSHYEENGIRILNGIEGRYGMKIFNKDGSYVTPTALNLHDELYCFIEGLQYYQNEMGILEVRIIPSSNYNDTIKQKFYNHFKSRLASDTVITIKHVKQLTKKENGKFLLLESNVAS